MYTLTPREYRALKSALTKALNSGDAKRIKAECEKAHRIFDAKGWPDDWSRWQRAYDDACFKQAGGVWS